MASRRGGGPGGAAGDRGPRGHLREAAQGPTVEAPQALEAYAARARLARGGLLSACAETLRAPDTGAA